MAAMLLVWSLALFFGTSAGEEECALLQTQASLDSLAGSAIVDQGLVDEVGAKIVLLIDAEPALAAKFLRLGFHDCVGGCDGCVDMEDPDNNGLLIPIKKLEQIVEEHTELSRADIWALATLVGAREAQNTKTNAPEYRSFAFPGHGRQDCAHAQTGIGGPKRHLPSANMATGDVLKYFEEEFNFTADETVALMGAHSIGSASRKVSGFNGTHGWVPNNDKLSNGYYNVLVGLPESMEHVTDWIPRKVDNSDLRDQGINMPDRWEWQHDKIGDVNGAVKRDEEGRSDKDTVKEWTIMLNTDIALARDFADYFDSETGEVTCQWRCRGKEGSSKCDQVSVCPSASTLTQLSKYREDNNKWLRDFEKVLQKMLMQGYACNDASESATFCELIART